MGEKKHKIPVELKNHKVPTVDLSKAADESDADADEADDDEDDDDEEQKHSKNQEIPEVRLAKAKGEAKHELKKAKGKAKGEVKHEVKKAENVEHLPLSKAISSFWSNHKKGAGEAKQQVKKHMTPAVEEAKEYWKERDAKPVSAPLVAK